MSDSEYSSEDDEDYVPEAESDDEEPADDVESEGKKPQKKQAEKKMTAARRKKGGIKLDDEEEDEEETHSSGENSEEETETLESIKEEKKALADKAKEEALWAAFKSDLPLTSVKKPTSSDKGQKKDGVLAAKDEQKVTITKTYDFAGEEVRVTKTVAADSAEAKKVKQDQEKTKTTSASASTPAQAPSASTAIPFNRQKRPGGGLGSVLGQLGKKTKMSTLEKSRLDWEGFKTKEGIADELRCHNKDGYLEKKDFLQRTDERQFETERLMRQGIRKR